MGMLKVGAGGQVGFGVGLDGQFLLTILFTIDKQQEMELEYSLPFVAAAQLGSRAERGALLRNVLAEENDEEEEGRWALAWPLLQPMAPGAPPRALPFTETAAALRFRAYQVNNEEGGRKGVDDWE
jgi:hypothetical protein